jgi:DUF4097 and DUF4098 domain-containing protein YvlB
MQKFHTFILVILLGAGSLQAQTSDKPFLTKSLSSESIHDIYARTSGGGIDVSGVSSGEARIEVYVYPSNNRSSLTKGELQEKLDKDYELTVSVEGNKLTAIAKPKDFDMNWKKALTISFKVFVPENVSTDLSTSGGGIALKNLSGTLNFSTSGGGLSLDQLRGKIHGRTSGGGITVTNTNDDIDLATSGGGIKASNCRGNLKLSTSGGSIDLNDLQGSIEAGTSGGPVRASGIKGELIARTSGGSVDLQNLSCSVEAHTSGGNMNVAITELGKYVNVSNSGGNIRLEVPANKGMDLKLRGERIKMDNVSNFNGDQEENKVTGKMNGGGIPVDARTSGNITLAVK